MHILASILAAILNSKWPTWLKSNRVLHWIGSNITVNLIINTPDMLWKRKVDTDDAGGGRWTTRDLISSANNLIFLNSIHQTNLLL